MALGGGTFLTQNKVLPGAYINFISVNKANASLSDRGYATMPLELDWGVDGEIFEVTNADFQKDSIKIFGYDYTSDKLKGLRDLFLNLKTLYAYRLNSGTKAENVWGTAKYSGIRGNDLKVVIKTNVDDVSAFDVMLLLGTNQVDIQTVKTAGELKDNDFIKWKTGAALTLTAGANLTGGTNGTVDGGSHQAYLDKVESYSFNIIGVTTTEDTIKRLYTSFTKRMRDEVGAKFQLVVHNQAADYEGVINVKNDVESDNIADLVYFVTGLQAGCEVNKSCLNRKYDGEYTVKADYTQTQLIKCIKDGEFTFHRVGPDIRVLQDINTMVTVSDEKGDVFKDNQTIRVIDQIANDIAILFNTKYLGTVPNDASGRVSFWVDIIKYHEQLEKIRAIEDFKDEHVVVSRGETKKSVDVGYIITVVNAMAQLYMTVRVA